MAMSKTDGLKEEISWLKVLCGLLMAGLASLLGWLAQNYATANRVIVAAALGCVLWLLGFIVASVVRIYRCIRKLEAL
jgi:hypothetical protein